MNIIEAFQRGGRVRRSGWDEYYTPAELLATRNLLPNAILASDWEVEEPKITISTSEFDRAWNMALQTSIAEGTLGSVYRFSDLLKKELGL